MDGEAGNMCCNSIFTHMVLRPLETKSVTYRKMLPGGIKSHRTLVLQKRSCKENFLLASILLRKKEMLIWPPNHISTSPLAVLLLSWSLTGNETYSVLRTTRQRYVRGAGMQILSFPPPSAGKIKNYSGEQRRTYFHCMHSCYLPNLFWQKLKVL